MSNLTYLLFLCAFLTKTKCQNVHTCGSVIKNEKQFLIQSDYYLQQYPPNQICEFTLKSDSNCDNNFNFQFLLFDLELSRGCTKDRLEISNLDSLCGQGNGIREYRSKYGELKLKFITDFTNSGRGFQILVTKLPCALLRNNNCCVDSYHLRKFYIASPDFPYNNARTDCIYKIYRANPNICRLRIHFKYFSNGYYYDCNSAFLEIDGRRFCGCKTGLSLISKFDKNWKNQPKIIRYRSGGENESFKGFLLEIIQDECPDKYSPEQKMEVPQLYYYNDQLNKIEPHNGQEVIFDNLTNGVTANNLDKFTQKGILDRSSEKTNDSSGIDLNLLTVNETAINNSSVRHVGKNNNIY